MEKLKIEIIKTGNENLIILVMPKLILNGTRGCVIENIEDVDYEGFNLSDEIRDICRKLFSTEGVFELQLSSRQILVFKTNKANWKTLEPQIISIFE